MRILHVTESFGAGVLTVVQELTARQASDGHEVAVAYGLRPETPPDARSAVDARVALFPTPWQRRTATAQVAAAARIRALVRDWRPDVVHLHSTFAGLVGAAAIGRSVPTVYSPQSFAVSRSSDGRLRQAAYRAATRLACRRVGAVAAASESEARLAQELAPGARVAVVVNGIGELDDGRAPGPPARDALRVASMGRVTQQRRPAETARILSAVRDLAEVEWIGGGDPSYEGVTALAEAGVELTGWLDHGAALDRLAQATAYLHWSAWDGAALAILEAMARDVVVVASDIGPNRDLVGDEQVARDERDATALLRAVLTDAELRERLLAGQRARRARYGAERMARECMALYREVGARAARRGGRAAAVRSRLTQWS